MTNDGKSLGSGCKRLKFNSHTFRGVNAQVRQPESPQSVQCAGVFLNNETSRHSKRKLHISNFQEVSIKTKWDRRNAKNAVLELTSQ